MEKILFFSVLFAALTLPVFAEGEQRQLLDQVVAIVNDDPITQSELDITMRPIYEDYKSQYKGEALMEALTDARRKLLNQMVEDKLVYQEAKNQKIEPDIDQVDKQLEDLKAKFKNETDLEDTLAKEGMSLSAMRERLERQSVIQHLHEMEVRAKVVVSPLEVEQFYEEHSNEFSSDETIRVRSITIKKNEDAREKGLTDEAAKSKIENLRKRVLAGQDFESLSTQSSEDISAKNGGLSDWIKPGEMIPEIDHIIFKLKKGEMSEVIETPMGYHLFRVEEKKEKYKKSFNEAREIIYGKIFREKSIKRFQEWLIELKRNAYVSIR
mgnify:CR=1 FL=1